MPYNYSGLTKSQGQYNYSGLTRGGPSLEPPSRFNQFIAQLKRKGSAIAQGTLGDVPAIPFPKRSMEMELTPGEETIKNISRLGRDIGVATLTEGAVESIPAIEAMKNQNILRKIAGYMIPKFTAGAALGAVGAGKEATPREIGISSAISSPLYAIPSFGIEKGGEAFEELTGKAFRKVAPMFSGVPEEAIKVAQEEGFGRGSPLHKSSFYRNPKIFNVIGENISNSYNALQDKIGSSIGRFKQRFANKPLDIDGQALHTKFQVSASNLDPNLFPKDITPVPKKAGGTFLLKNPEQVIALAEEAQSRRTPEQSISAIASMQINPKLGVLFKVGEKMRRIAGMEGPIKMSQALDSLKVIDNAIGKVGSNTEEGAILVPIRDDLSNSISNALPKKARTNWIEARNNYKILQDFREQLENHGIFNAPETRFDITEPGTKTMRSRFNVETGPERLSRYLNREPNDVSRNDVLAKFSDFSERNRVASFKEDLRNASAAQALYPTPESVHARSMVVSRLATAAGAGLGAGVLTKRPLTGLGTAAGIMSMTSPPGIATLMKVGRMGGAVGKPVAKFLKEAIPVVGTEIQRSSLIRARQQVLRELISGKIREEVKRKVGLP